jgi:hypothetical protein
MFPTTVFYSPKWCAAHSDEAYDSTVEEFFLPPLCTAMQSRHTRHDYARCAATKVAGSLFYHRISTGRTRGCAAPLGLIA